MGLSGLRDQIQSCGAELHAWGSSKTKPETEEIKRLQKKLELLNASEMTEESRNEFLLLSKHLDDLLLKQEVFWRQRSRVSWLKYGDRNTKFFHSKASQRRRRNFIEGIKNADGVWVEEVDEVAAVASNYFMNIFKAGTCDKLEECLDAVDWKMSADMLEVLSRPYSSEEVRTALFQMGPTKAPGPDGMNALFYQKFWHIVGPEVTEAVLDFLHTGHMVPDINYTHIVLIPKVKKPEKMADFRPISLCNVIYKIISKVLANRLKLILPQLISPTQSAFVPGRLITDNVMVAYETLHAMHSRKKGKKGALALKLDVSKAYDRVEWGFLKGMMLKLGFPEFWVDRVMCCVTTPSFSVRINGKAYGNITPSRGIRQGDPLSPYMFLLCAEGFTSLLARKELEGRLHRVALCRNAPSISNLLFADDSLIFCQANNDEVQVVSDTLQLYAEASGQCINLEKSSAYFSSNVSVEQKTWIVDKLKVKEVARFDNYLGLPTLIGRRKYETFAFLKERVWRKLQGWKGKMLSKAGKEVLIKAVAQSIPTYTMGVFQLPGKLCDKLDSMCARFWWGQVGEERKIHWKSWSFLTQPKKEGGMGFRDLKSFNLAMLAKQGWRLLQDKGSLLYRCLKAKYFPRCDFLDATDCQNSSYVWKSLLAAQPILKKGCYWRVGNGASIRVLKDCWLPNHPTKKILFPPEEEIWEWRVSDLVDWQTHQWDRERIMAMFHQFDAEAILQVPLSRRVAQDGLVWSFTKRGRYNVRSGYFVAKQLRKDELNAGESSEHRALGSLWSRLWKAVVPSKIKIFSWRACLNIMPTQDNLIRRRVMENARCCLCHQETETVLHVLWSCGVVQDVWVGSLGRLQKSGTAQNDFLQLVTGLLVKLSDEEWNLFWITCWLIWHQRNTVIHGGVFQHPSRSAQRAVDYLKEYSIAQDSLHVPIPNHGPVQQTWQPPPETFFKLNFDGACFDEGAASGYGAVIRNEKGDVMAALAVRGGAVRDSEEVEVMACRKALEFAIDAGFTEIVLEGDNALVMKMITQAQPDLSRLGLIYEDIWCLAAGFRSISYNCIRRSANGVAHSLARFARLLDNEIVWLEEDPPPAVDALYLDSSFLN